VLFPGGRLSLRIFEQRYVDMTKACLRDDTPFGVCLIREGEEAGTPAVPCEVGCTARIREWDVPSPGLFSLVTEGDRVFRILGQRVASDGLIRAEVALEPALIPTPLPSEFESLSRLLQALIDQVGAEHFPSPPRFGEAEWVGHRLAELLPISALLRQQLLEAQSTPRLLQVVQSTLRAIGDEQSEHH
jgi:Lon protease-like protein